ncbi:MAG: hypothetical protein K2X66_04755, partial [Cyanobacteria bacterium]|nr:hypothetical protein [Cyanobacteriota bacterium]
SLLIKAKGISTTEYALVIGLVVIVSIPLLMTLGNLSNQELKATETHQSDFTNLNDLITSNSPGNYSTSLGSAQPGIGTIQYTLQDGTSITLNNFPTDIPKLVETLGPNGTTDLISNALVKLSQKLRAEGKIEDTQLSQFRALAENGHNLAREQELLVQVSKEAGVDKKKFEMIYNQKIPEGIFDYVKGINDVDPNVQRFFGLTETNGGGLRNDKGEILFLNNKKYERSNYLTNSQVNFMNAYGKLISSQDSQNKTLDTSTLQMLNFFTRSIHEVNDYTQVYRNAALTPAIDGLTVNLNDSVANQSHKYSQNICNLNGKQTDTGIRCP